MKLTSAERAMLSMALGVRPLSPFRCDQRVLYRLMDRDYVAVSWKDGTVFATGKGRDAWDEK